MSAGIYHDSVKGVLSLCLSSAHIHDRRHVYTMKLRKIKRSKDPINYSFPEYIETNRNFSKRSLKRRDAALRTRQ